MLPQHVPVEVRNTRVPVEVQTVTPARPQLPPQQLQRPPLPPQQLQQQDLLQQQQLRQQHLQQLQQQQQQLQQQGDRRQSQPQVSQPQVLQQVQQPSPQLLVRRVSQQPEVVQQEAPRLVVRQGDPEVLQQQLPPSSRVLVRPNQLDEDRSTVKPLAGNRVFQAPAQAAAPQMVYQAQLPQQAETMSRIADRMPVMTSMRMSSSSVTAPVTQPVTTYEPYQVENVGEQYYVDNGYIENDFQLGESNSFVPEEAGGYIQQPEMYSQAGPYQLQLEEEEIFDDAEQMQQQLQLQMMQQQPEQSGDSNNQFHSLLASLEARVDLMAQMQHTRAAIQKRANAIQEMRTRQLGNGSGAESLPTTDISAMGQELVPYSAGQQFYDDDQQIEQQYDNNMQLQLQPYQANPVGTMVDAEAAAALAQENQELWMQFQEQKNVIGRLTGDIEGMRTQLTELSQRGMPSMPPCDGRRPSGQDHMLQADDIMNVLRNQTTAIDVFSEEMRNTLRQQQQVKDDEVQRLEQQLAAERQAQELATLERLEERDRLHAELMEARAATAATGMMNTTGSVMSFCSPMDMTSAVTPATQTNLNLDPNTVAQLDRQSCGVNLSLSEDGYTAIRARGCRQSVGVGLGPVPKKADGWYYELTINETVTGWVGGLGIGVTTTSPAELEKVPDKAWRIPRTFVVGYWGCIFLDGKEFSTKWRADDLEAGTRVGVLVTNYEGDLVIFVDDVPEVCCQGALLAGGGVLEPLYPVIDVFAATKSVTLAKRAEPPHHPWKKDPKRLEPPGDPHPVPIRNMDATLSGTTMTGTAFAGLTN